MSAPSVADLADHRFAQSLALETKDARLFRELFASQRWTDVSRELAHQRAGTDVLWYPDGRLGAVAPVRVECKYEQKTTRNIALEVISQDRRDWHPDKSADAQLVGGWMLTSHAAVLLSFFSNSGDLAVLPMAPLRAWLWAHASQLDSAPAPNKPPGNASRLLYVSHCYIPPVVRVLREVPGALWLDLRRWTESEFPRPSMVRNSGVDEVLDLALFDLLAAGPTQSEPSALDRLSVYRDCLARSRRKGHPGLEAPWHAAHRESVAGTG